MAFGDMLKKIKNIKFDKKNLFAIICTILAIILISLFTPLFDVSEILTEGNATIPYEVIVRASGIHTGDSFFKVNPREAAEKIAKVAYVDSVKVRRVFPGKIKFVITESTESAYISFAGNYVGIDSKGKILEVRQQLDENSKPVIKGVNIENFTIGSHISVDSEEKKDLLFEMIESVNEKDAAHLIRMIDITDDKNIFLVLKNNITVKYGDSSGLKYKTAYLRTVFDELVNETGGILDISDTANVIYSN